MLAPLRHRLVPQLPKPKIRFAVGLESEALQAWVTILEEESHTYRQAANETRTAAREALQLCTWTFQVAHKLCKEHFCLSWRGEMSRSGLRDDSHHSTLHAFFLAAKESGCTDFELQLVANPKGRVEFCISPREHSEMSAKFEVRGNTVRAAASEARVVPADDADVNYGGTRSGEEPVRVSPGTRSSPPRRPAAVTCRDPQKMDWTPWSL
jgi:hypothetical protein